MIPVGPASSPTLASLEFTLAELKRRARELESSHRSLRERIASFEVELARMRAEQPRESSVVPPSGVWPKPRLVTCWYCGRGINTDCDGETATVVRPHVGAAAVYAHRKCVPPHVAQPKPEKAANEAHP